MYSLTPRQRAFLKTATPSERDAFLARGPAEAAPLYPDNGGQILYAAMLRGCLVNGTRYTEPSQAAQDAETERTRAAASGQTLDEVALDLDDTARELDQDLDAASVAIEAVIVLAGVNDATMPDMLHHLLCEIEVETVRAWTWIPSFARRLRIETPCQGGSAYDPARHSVLDDPHPRRAERAILEAFLQALHDDAGYGFLAVGRQPLARVRPDGSITYSWSHTQTCLRYGRSAEAAIRAVLDWGEENWNRLRAEAAAA